MLSLCSVRNTRMYIYNSILHTDYSKRSKQGPILNVQIGKIGINTHIMLYLNIYYYIEVWPAIVRI